MAYTERAFLNVCMKISLNWLKDYVVFEKKLTPETIAWRLTEATAEIEKIFHHGEGLETVVVGEILGLKKHPKADMLEVAQVDVGQSTIQIVFNREKAGVQVGDKIPTALVPTQLPGGEVTETEFLGVKSQGMLCLDSEMIEGAKEVVTLIDSSAKNGTPVSDLLHIQDIVFEIDNHSITHRPDLFSHYGFARECVALGFASWKKKWNETDPKKMLGEKVLPLRKKFVSDRITKNYFSTIIENVSVVPSPAWAQARLRAIGIRPINAIVDISNLVMMDLGQPVHTFDADILVGKTLTHRLSKKGEKVTTLDGMKRTLNDDVIVIDCDGEIVDLCGIMGAENSEIHEQTKNVYLHVCHYDHVLIRRAMIDLGHRTDAGTLFEKNLEPERAKVGLVRCLELFKAFFPEASFEYQLFHHQQESSPQPEIELSFQKMNHHLGIEIDPKRTVEILEALEFGVKMRKTGVKVSVPSWRAQGVTIPEDVIEEVVRIHGYSNVASTSPPLELCTPVKNHKRHLNRLMLSFFIGQGFLEEANFSFLSEDLLNKLSYAELDQLIEIANPVSDDFRFMRPSFLPYMLSNLSRNQISDPARVWKTFEMGALYSRLDKDVIEHHQLAALISSQHQTEIFFEAKGLLESLLREASLQYRLTDGEHEYAIGNRCLTLEAHGVVIGHLYEIHPALRESFKVKGSVVVIELNLDELYELPPEEIFYTQINRNPKALLDISVVVDEGVKAEQIQSVIGGVRSEYLSELELVDVYQGKSLGDGKKSFTYALSYQHPERTLDEKEIQALLDELIEQLEAAGGVVRR